MVQPPPIFLEIDLAMRDGRMDDAVALARQALDAGLEHPVTLSLRAWGLEREGRPADALADLERLRVLGVSDPNILTATARCLTQLGRGEDALVNLTGALVLAPGEADIWYEKGVAHETIGELLDARTAFDEALKRNPHHWDALARQATLAARRSDWPAARQLADQVLAEQPFHTLAQFAHVMADLAKKDYGVAERRARLVAESPHTIPMAKATAFNYLGDALDGLNRRTEAFEAYAAGNNLQMEIFQPRFAQMETGLPMATRIHAALEQWPTASSVVPRQSSPIFLVGFARAGTSLLGQILAGHSGVLALEEKPLFSEALERFFFNPQGLAELENLPVAQAAYYRSLYWEHVRQEVGRDPREQLIVDQTPLNTLHLPLIARLFPGATVLFAVRDPRDVVLSCFRRLFTLHRYTWEFLSLERTAQLYDLAMQIQTLARQKLDLRFCDIRNEDLVVDFEGQMRRVCTALKLDWEPALADFAQASRARGVATPSAPQIARGLNADGIGQWRRYGDQMAGVLPLLEPWARHFGYGA